MAWLSLIFGGLLLLYVATPKYKKTTKRYLKQMKLGESTRDLGQGKAINLNSLSNETWRQKVLRLARNVNRQLGSGAVIKLIAFIALLGFLSIYINNNFVRTHLWAVVLLIEIAGLYLGYVWLQNRERAAFDSAFPDALNMLTSAVSSGESLTHAIVYVGKTLDGEVGAEFKLMGERLQMGESPDAVFRKACKRFPFPSFYFFIITMRANMQRGGQLKDVMSRLNRLMFDARAVDKKKYALTAEARASAKIVGAIPFIFLFLLQFLSPENYEYVMFNPDGRYILYYVIVSECIGMFIVWRLMKGVEA
ncbi:pilus assembly protein TadB [Vibrio sinensis]|uniref:Pilus assembly protein TadB n=1 Tax=Vibrio sinensis TaxID=2302434 RepID=A0A3A6QB39_9VIBR|nr:type II secretion system F family protein [Vibrio sinensis]RJX68441.1 pilus assembly protein TadB [Vibrio sinensis]